MPYYMQAPAVDKIRMVSCDDTPLHQGVEDPTNLCHHCGRNRLKPEPLYSTFLKFALSRIADTKTTENLNGPDASELVMRLRAVIRSGPERGVYVFETSDGKRLRDAWIAPSVGYDPALIHNFAEWIKLGAEMSEKDPRDAAVLSQPPRKKKS